MSTAALDQLEASLAASGQYENNKDAAAAATRDFFVARKGVPPTADAISLHFLVRSYSRLEIPDTATQGVLEEAFYELTLAGMFARYRGESETHFARAEAIKNLMSNAFYDAEYSFLSGLSGAELEKKLACDTCYEDVNKMLQQDTATAFALIGTGFDLAQSMGGTIDTKRRYDFLMKCHFALYSVALASGKRPYYHTALALGKYLKGESGPYSSLKMWSHFHDGNIRMSLGFYEGGGTTQYDAAKLEYEGGLNAATAMGLNYAIMTMQEKMGTVHSYLKEPALANQFFDASEATSHDSDIKPFLADRNQVSGLIGLGNSAFESAAPGDDSAYGIAEKYYRAASELANQINYAANEKIALRSLARLYEKWGKPPDAALVSQMAEAVKCGFDYDYR